MKKTVSKIKNRVRKQPAKQLSPHRITNETVAEYREEVLGKARKYIYPLQHSKHRLVKISVSLFLVAIIVFFSYCILALYRFQSNSTFIYKVTQVVPFPIARSGTDFVAYENYLFELNHYIHYYRFQQQLDFNSDAGKQQLAEQKKRSLDKVVNDAYVKELAQRKGITVSDREVEDEIAVVRSQNRLGASDKEFQGVLKDFWNWSESDFKRSLKTQILAEKVTSAYDTGAHDRANAAFARLKNGEDFGKLAGELSEEPSSKANAGEYGFTIEKNNRDIDPAVTEVLYNLKDGQISEVIDVGYGLEIVKRVKVESDGKVTALHMVFTFKDIDDQINELKDQKKTTVYLRL